MTAPRTPNGRGPMANRELVDLSMPVEHHWRFALRLAHRDHEAAGCAFHSTDVAMGAHAFTHVDAPWHVTPEGARMRDVPPDRLWGEAAVLDVSDLGADAALDADALRERGGHVRPGDIVVLRSDHERRYPTTDARYWTAAPYVTGSGAGWLREREPAAVGFDFPQDRAIRAGYLPDFAAHPGGADEDWACHRILLTAGIPQIEYLANLHAIGADRTLLFALPLRLEDADGAPVRAFALRAGGEAG